MLPVPDSTSYSCLRMIAEGTPDTKIEMFVIGESITIQCETSE